MYVVGGGCHINSGKRTCAIGHFNYWDILGNGI